MKADIYFLQFLKDDAESVGGGGIGTLISYLCPLIEELGHEVTVYQCAGREFDVKWGNARVIGVPGYPAPGRPNEKVAQNLRNLAFRRAETAGRLEIFAADFFAVKNDNPLAICIQNGLAWDATIDLLTPKGIYHTLWGEKLFRYRCQLRGLRRFESCYNRVAVDLCFINWYRSFRGPDCNGRLFYNPNPAPQAAWDPEREHAVAARHPIRIIFARRFVPEKGTRVMASVFQDLLRLRPNVRITLAGEGPDRELFERVFGGDNRVTITAYRTEDALAVHRGHDIAVIPSLCGEATCLSVIEAMAAGCAVLATNMGGTSTEIINGYNGVLCFPVETEIREGLLGLVDDHEQRLSLQKAGWETSQRGFSFQRWRETWQSILKTVAEGRSAG